MGYKLNGCDTEGIPLYLLKPLLEYVSIPTIVECGTAGGDSIMAASKYFKKCHTIELIPNRARIGKPIKNIIWHTGNSVDILPQIISELDKDEYCLFWIDAHYSDSTPNTSEYKECYILEELEIIYKEYGNRAIILIDDARLFMGHPPSPCDPRDWANLGEIFKVLNQFEFHINTVIDDYILSYPDSVQDPLNTEWRTRFNTRYPSAEDKLKSEVKNVYSALKNYIK